MWKSNIAKLGDGYRTLDSLRLPNSGLNLEHVAAATIESTPYTQLEVRVLTSEEVKHNKNASDISTMLGASFNPNLIGDVGIPSTLMSLPTFDVDLSAMATMSFLKDIRMDEQHIYVFIRKCVESNEEINDVTLSSYAEQLIAKQDIASFYTAYGDRFISHITKGSEVLAIIRLDNKSNLTINASQENNNPVKVGSSSNASASSNTDNGKNNIANSVTAAISGDKYRDQESFKNISSSGCWIYIAGVENSKAFILDSKDLSSLLTSIYTLLKFDVGTASEVALRFKTMPYSVALLNANSLKPGQIPRTMVQSSFTKALLHLGRYILSLKGLVADIQNARRDCLKYGNEYDGLWRKMQLEHEKYKGKDERRVCKQNRDQLFQISQRLEEMAGHVISELLKSAEIDSYMKELEHLKNSMERVYSAYSSTQEYQFMQTIHHKKGKEYSASFYIKGAEKAKFLFFRSSHSQAPNIQFEIKKIKFAALNFAHAHTELLGQHPTKLTYEYLPIFDRKLEANGDYVPNLFEPSEEYILEAEKERENFEIEVYSVEDELPPKPPARRC